MKSRVMTRALAVGSPWVDATSDPQAQSAFIFLPHIFLSASL